MAGCGEGTDDESAEPPPTETQRADKPKPPTDKPKPRAGAGSKVETAKRAEADSRELCGSFGMETAGQRYEEEIPARIAAAYARETYQGKFPQDARRGCLHGLLANQ